MDKIIIEYFNEVYPEQLRKIKNPPSRDDPEEMDVAIL